MKQKVYSNKSLKKDNIKLTAQLHNCMTANIDLKITHEQGLKAIERANAQIKEFNAFLDSHPLLAEQYRKWKTRG